MTKHMQVVGRTNSNFISLSLELGLVYEELFWECKFKLYNLLPTTYMFQVVISIRFPLVRTCFEA